MIDRIIGWFSDADPVHQTDDPIPANFDGADQFICEHCDRLLMEVANG